MIVTCLKVNDLTGAIFSASQCITARRTVAVRQQGHIIRGFGEGGDRRAVTRDFREIRRVIL